MSKKNTTIFSAESANIEALGMKALPANDFSKLLSESGRSAFAFQEGDVITLYPEQVFQKTVTRKDRDGKDILDKDNKPVVITRLYYGAVRNNMATLIPVSAMRLMPSFHAYEDPTKAQADFFEGFEQHRVLSQASDDYARQQWLKAHPTFVVKMTKGKGVDWQKSDLATRSFVYKDQDFPRFDFDAVLD